MQIVFASSNQNKIAEIGALMPAGFKVLGLNDIGITEEIPEPGATIKENSFLKASYVTDFLKAKGQALPVFADDSGLEVAALNNAPGVYSARYAGVPKNDVNNNTKLLKALEQHTDRRARFITVIALMLSGNVHYFEGEVKGIIAYEPRGAQVFGYDPLFIPEGYSSTFAELGPGVKNTISHRALAVKQLLSFMRSSL